MNQQRLATKCDEPLDTETLRQVGNACVYRWMTKPFHPLFVYYRTLEENSMPRIYFRFRRMYNTILGRVRTSNRDVRFGGSAMTRQDWNLLVLAAAEGQPLSPVQLQKSLFLLGKNLPGCLFSGGFYNFEPYDYGPFDATVYGDARTLAAGQLVNLSSPPHGRWEEYSVTPVGYKKAEQLSGDLRPEVVEYVRNLVRWVRSLSFAELVRHVYNAYPDYKVNSVFKD